MGTKSKMKKQKQVHALESYSAAVGSGVQSALKGDLQRMGQDIYNELNKNLQADFGSTFKALGHRIQAMLDMFLAATGLTEEAFNEKVLDVEDESDGYIKSSFPVRRGDRVRFVIKDASNDSDEQKIKLDNLLVGKPQLHGAIEDSMLGMHAGETKTVNTTIGEGETKKDYSFVLTMKRISTKVVKDEEKKEEVKAQSDA